MTFERQLQRHVCAEEVLVDFKRLLLIGEWISIVYDPGIDQENIRD